MKKQFITLLFLALGAFIAFAQNQDAGANRRRMDALFQEVHDAATWGLPNTNGIQLGVAIVNGTGVKQFRVFTYLYDETNCWIGLYPPNGYRLSLSLKDSDGKEVERTKEGKAINKPVGRVVKAEMKMRAGRIQGGFDLLPKKTPVRYETPFNLFDCFNIARPGTNVLMVGATLYGKNNDDGLYKIMLPPVFVKVPAIECSH